MIFRSLRWRLGFAMTLIIVAVLAAAGVFSSMTVKREFDRFIVTQRNTDLAQYDVRIAADGALHLTRREGGIREEMVLKTEPIRVGDRLVYLVPRPPKRETAFPAIVNRRLLAGVAAASLLAIAVILTLFRRVFAPVEELTLGARSLAGGRLDTRVRVRGDDEVAELASAFNSMAEALERNEKARRNMVSDVAHELRTPLTSIRAQLEAVQDGVMTADAKWLASIEEDAATLARLVDDLQQLSLAEAGQLRLELEDVEVAELVERAWGAGVPPAWRAGSPPSIPRGMIVRVDVRRMVQVLRNLLVNAATHANSAIDVSASRAGNRIEIRVIDDGPGVPPEHAGRIFDRFYRADPSRSRATGGAGLGLAIAKELVELHGGTIRYERPAFIITL